MSRFVSVFLFKGCPPIPAFNTLRADLPCRISAICDEHDYGAFIGMTDAVLELDTIFRPTSILQSSRPSRPPPVLPTSVPFAAPILSQSVHPPCPSKKDCGNCRSHSLRSTGHTDETCFCYDFNQPNKLMTVCISRRCFVCVLMTQIRIPTTQLVLSYMV